MRPRDLLVFLRQCVDSAINRGNAKVTVEDILLGEKAYSDEMLYSVAEEIADTRPEWQDALYAFEGAEAVLSIAQVEQLLAEARPEIDDAGIADGIELLLRFGFLGVLGPGSLDPTYVHTVGFNMRRLLDGVRRRRASLVIHPAFQEALGIVRTSG